MGRYRRYHVRFLAGERMTDQQFCAAVARSTSSMRKTATYFVGRDLAEDVASDAILRAWRVRDQWRGSGIKTWLVTITRHTALESLRTARRRPQRLGDQDLEQLAINGLLDQGLDPEQCVLHYEDLAMVHEAVAELPGFMRAGLELWLAGSRDWRAFTRTRKSHAFRARRIIISAVRARMSFESPAVSRFP